MCVPGAVPSPAGLYISTVCVPSESATSLVYCSPNKGVSYPKNSCSRWQVNGRNGANMILSESMALRAV